MGAASRPPAMSLRGMSASSTITATATFGSSTGANEVNQANGLRLGSDWAVPVLPADLDAGDLGVAARCPR